MVYQTQHALSKDVATSKEWKSNNEIPYLDSVNILYSTCFDSVHKRNPKINDGPNT